MMKCIIASFLMVFLFVSCNGDKKQKDEHPEDMGLVVGKVEGNTFELMNTKRIEKEWSERVSPKGELITFKGFEIIKGKTQGDSKDDFYMLYARTDDGATRVAALLTLLDGEFYFQKNETDTGSIYTVIQCNGDCAEGCLPIVIDKNGNKHLSCSPCDNCLKTEKSIIQ